MTAKDFIGSLTFALIWQGTAAAATGLALFNDFSLASAVVIGGIVGAAVVGGLNCYGETHHSHTPRKDAP